MLTLRALPKKPARRLQNRRVVLGAWMIMLGIGACQTTSPLERERNRLSIRRDASRFVVASSTDSTVTFRPVEARWLKKGMRGYVVDPMQRDVLIARLTIQRVDTGGTIAVIDGGVAPVVMTHVVLVERPALVWWKDKRFWGGAGAGVVAGVIAASASK